ncbi:transferase [Candidatus Woesearchaeota archaeon]|nr:transferase [Candidatus Woesearchaeota archaeon]
MKKVYKNVEIGGNAKIDEFVIIGKPARGRDDGEKKTLIGINPVIRAFSIIYAGNKIGDNLETGHYTMIREDNKIGNNVSIGSKSMVEHDVVIEDDVRVHSQAFIPEYCILKKGCWIGPNVVLTNTLHPLCREAKKCLKKTPVIVGENAKIGANSTILPGVKIGKNALVGAGSVVVKDVPEGKVAVGNPAKIVKDVKDIGCFLGMIEKPYP